MLCSDLLHLPVVKKKSHILSSENYDKPEGSNSQFMTLTAISYNVFYR